MGHPNQFDLENPPVRPAGSDLLVKALLAFANADRIVLWQSGEIRQWSHWRAEPSTEERAAHVRFLQAAMENPWSALGFFTADNSGQPRPTNAVIEFSGRIPNADCALLPDQNLYLCLEHMHASIDRSRGPFLVGRRRSYSLTDYRCYTNVASALTVAMLLLVDDSEPYSKALCRCKLPRCQNFYLARRNPKGGPANRSYCSPEHRKEYQDSADRKKLDRGSKARHK